MKIIPRRNRQKLFVAGLIFVLITSIIVVFFGNKPSFHDTLTVSKKFENNHFIECDYEQARKYKQKYELHLSPEEKEFKMKTKKMIQRAKAVLDKLQMPFWLSSGTLLGWYRQCDVIPYTSDVDLEVFSSDYDAKILKEMHKVGFDAEYPLKKINDSILQFNFFGIENIELDIFFVFEEVDHFWYGGLIKPDRANKQAKELRKYKFKYPKFTLCWTEFLEMKVRVPCKPEKYLQANYGTHWKFPDKDWIVTHHPANL